MELAGEKVNIVIAQALGETDLPIKAVAALKCRRSVLDPIPNFWASAV
jgi:hypothetical protein